jgi:HK97 family phage portal protein
MWPFARKEIRTSLENPSVSLADAAAWAQVFGSWFQSASGVTVSYEKAIGVPAIWAAVNFISSTIASLPLDLYKRTDEGRQIADKDPLYALLHDAVNDGLTSFQWRKLLMQNVLTGGRGVTFIERNKAQRVMNLWPLDPANTSVVRKDGKVSYVYKEGNKTTAYQPSEVIDIPFMLQPDGIGHHNPFERLKNAIGLSIAQEEYASRFFRNGGVPPLQLVGPLSSPGAVSRAKTDITEMLKAAKADDTQVIPMPQGHELKAVGIEPQKSQLIEGRKESLRDVARMYQLPPVFLQDLEFGTFTNTEQQDLHVVKHTISQWLKLWEQELNLKLFSLRNRKNFVEFNVDGLLRGDFGTRMEGYAKAITNAINTPNEVRRLENWPDHSNGNDLLIQGATVPLGQQKQQSAKPAKPDQTQEDQDAAAQQ